MGSGSAARHARKRTLRYRKSRSFWINRPAERTSPHRNPLSKKKVKTMKIIMAAMGRLICEYFI
jgi:hypothetical protein